MQSDCAAKRNDRHAASNESKHDHEARDALLPRQFILSRACVSVTLRVLNFRNNLTDPALAAAVRAATAIFLRFPTEVTN